jgi:hypothetical protein
MDVGCADGSDFAATARIPARRTGRLPWSGVGLHDEGMDYVLTVMSQDDTGESSYDVGWPCLVDFFQGLNLLLGSKATSYS